MPEADFTGQATISLQADDGFTTSQPIVLTVNVSNAKLQVIHIERISVLKNGQTASLKITGDFEDEKGVLLPASYVQLSSSDAAILEVRADGQVRAISDGIALIHAQARGIEGINALTVDIEGI